MCPSYLKLEWKSGKWPSSKSKIVLSRFVLYEPLEAVRCTARAARLQNSTIRLVSDNEILERTVQTKAMRNITPCTIGSN